jgi:hypothetical protein
MTSVDGRYAAATVVRDGTTENALRLHYRDEGHIPREERDGRWPTGGRT